MTTETETASDLSGPKAAREEKQRYDVIVPRRVGFVQARAALFEATERAMWREPEEEVSV